LAWHRRQISHFQRKFAEGNRHAIAAQRLDARGPKPSRRRALPNDIITERIVNAGSFAGPQRGFLEFHRDKVFLKSKRNE